MEENFVNDERSRKIMQWQSIWDSTVNKQMTFLNFVSGSAFRKPCVLTDVDLDGLWEVFGMNSRFKWYADDIDDHIEDVVVYEALPYLRFADGDLSMVVEDDWDGEEYGDLPEALEEDVKGRKFMLWAMVNLDNPTDKNIEDGDYALAHLGVYSVDVVASRKLNRLVWLREEENVQFGWKVG